MSASLIGRLGSSTFRLSATPVSMSLTGSRFSSDSAPRPLYGAPQQQASQFDARVTSLSLHAVASLELPSQLPIQGIGPATAQGDGEEDEAPEQRVFPPPATGGKTCGPVGDKRDDGELDGGCRRDQAGEQRPPKSWIVAIK